MKTVGFITNYYHSEVLEFLFNLYEGDVSFVWYHNIDWHGNKSLYKEKYGDNLEIRGLDKLWNDIRDDVCELFYFAEFENLIKLETVPESFKSKIILIGHSQAQIEKIRGAGMKYITLTPTLCEGESVNYMVPITYEKSIDLEGLKVKQLSKRNQNGKRLSIGMVGVYNKSRDMQRVNRLVENDVVLYIFTRLLTQELFEFYHRHVILGNKSNVHIMLNLSTEQILEMTNVFNIECIVLLPSKECNIYSGSINFAYNHFIPLLTTRKVADVYNLRGVLDIDDEEMINSYKSGEMTNGLIESMNEYKKQTYIRNNTINYLITKRASLQMSCSLQNLKKIKRRDGYNVCVGIGDGINILKLMCYTTGKFVLIEKNINKAKEMKKTLIKLDIIDRCVIFNNIANDHDVLNVLEGVDAICLDNLICDISDIKVDNIYLNINKNDISILSGASKIITRDNPTIITNTQ